MWKHWIHDVLDASPLRPLRRARMRALRLARAGTVVRRVGAGSRNGRRCPRHRPLRSPRDLAGRCRRGRLRRARHPERVSHLILYGAYARGWAFRDDPRGARSPRRHHQTDSTRMGPEQSGIPPDFTRRASSPTVRLKQADWFDDLQRITASPENAARFMEEFSRIDVRAIAPRHQGADDRFPQSERRARGPFDEGRLLAAAIRGRDVRAAAGPESSAARTRAGVADLAARAG